MKAKQLVPLIALLVLLGGLAVVKKSGLERRSRDLSASAVLEELTPGFAESFVSRITLERPGAGADDETIVMEKDAAGKWKMVKPFAAQANPASPERILKAMTGLRGELRSEDPDILGDYKLGDNQGFRIRLDAADGKALAEIAVGETRPNGYENFARKPDSPKVYLVKSDLLASISIWSREAKLNHKNFIELRAMPVETSKIERVEIHDGKSAAPLTLVKKADAWTWDPDDPKSPIEPMKAAGFVADLSNLYGSAALDPAKEAADFAPSAKLWVRLKETSVDMTVDHEIWLGPADEEKKTVKAKILPGDRYLLLSSASLEALKRDKASFVQKSS